MNQALKKWVARSLLVSLLNPAMLLRPAWALDTDIYAGFQAVDGNTVRPNVLLLLDTSDSMNLPEDWREYPGDYDSHVEYLWADASSSTDASSKNRIIPYPFTPIYSQFDESSARISLGLRPVVSIKYSGSTATVKTFGNHGYSTGWSVTISNASPSVYNGTFTIASVESTTSFTVALPSAPAANASAVYTANGQTISSFSVTTASSVSTATVTTSTAHGFSNNDVVLIEGADVANMLYNGKFKITKTGDKTFTYTLPGTTSTTPAKQMYAMARSPNLSSKYGFWGGGTAAERMQLLVAASASSLSYHANDDADHARRHYRNYNDPKWIYWLPARAANTSDDVAEADKRLRSPSFNRWAGSIATIAGIRGGLDFGATNSDSRNNNQCGSSMSSLYPSTVFAPTAYSSNTGKYLGQQWQRWERFLFLRNGRTSDADTTYPTSVGTDMVPNSGTKSIAEGSHTGKAGVKIQANQEYTGTSDGTGQKRDSWPRVPAFTSSYTDIGNQGQPIRTEITGGSSRAGWTTLKADLGGFNFADAVNGMDGTILADTLKIYQSAYNSVTPSAANAKSLAWKGNRDDATVPAFGKELGTPAYYDSVATLLRLGETSDTKCTRTCQISAITALGAADGAGITRKWFDQATATCTSLTLTPNPASSDNCTQYPPVACGSPQTGDDYVSAKYSCSWKNRQKITLEGGTYAYGGTCTGTCAGESCVTAAESSANCTISGLAVVYYQGSPLENATEGSSTSTGCNARTTQTKTCPDRQNNATCAWAADTPCLNSTSSGSHSATDYSVYSLKGKDDYLTHDCRADNGTANNPSSYYLAAPVKLSDSSYPPFGSAFSLNTGDGKPYVKDAPADGIAAADMYSVNYLNWKFGPRGPNGNPIGRKTRLQIAKDVLVKVLDQLVATGSAVRVGLMSFNQMDSEGRSRGAHLDKAIVDLTAGTRDALVSKINSLTASSATPLTESLYEAYLYYSGAAPFSGNLTTTAKAGGAINKGVDTSADAMNDSSYRSPITVSCQENIVILVTDGAPENDDKANTTIRSLPTNNGTSIARTTSSGQFEVSEGVPYGPKDTNPVTAANQYVLLDELAFYMANSDARPDMEGIQTIKLHTVGFAGVEAPVLEKAAQVGGGGYTSATDAQSLEEAITRAIQFTSQWQPQASTPTVTYNVAAGESDAAYVAAVSPTTSVAWSGTIKRFRFGFGEGDCGPASCGNPNLCLIGQTVVDATCQRNVEEIQVDPTVTDSGNPIPFKRIRAEAVSFWMPIAFADGGSGVMGGTGQVLINPSQQPGSPSARNLFTFLSGTSSNTTLSNAANVVSTANANISKAVLGDESMSDEQREALINYALGSDGGTTANWRGWAHFDSVHSRPLVNTDTANNVTLFYLTSDGVLHAVNAATGEERWAFMVEEGLAKIAAIKANASGNHLEVADGSPVIVTTADDKRLIVFGMRRGGRAYYALDITTVTAPTFAWKISNQKTCEGTICAVSTVYSELGYTWSTPAVGTVRGQRTVASPGVPSRLKPVLIFGGGYDTNQDNASAGTDSIGRAVFVVDAASGNLIRSFDTNHNGNGAVLNYSIPADVLALDTTGDADGTLDRVYVGDMGGNLWRMDLDDRTAANAPAQWSIVQLASLNLNGRSNKLFNRPTMAPASYKSQIFDAVFVGGGDLQRPTDNAAALTGSMFMVKDFAVSRQLTASPDPLPNVNGGHFIDMTSKTNAGDLEAVNPSTGTSLSEDLRASIGGWVVHLSNGEKVSSDAQVFGGELYFGTYLPRQNVSAGACAVGGYGRQYAVSALTAAPFFNNDGTTQNPYASGRSYAAIYGFGRALSPIGRNGNPYLGGPLLPAQSITNSLMKVYWYSVPER